MNLGSRAGTRCRRRRSPFRVSITGGRWLVVGGSKSLLKITLIVVATVLAFTPLPRQTVERMYSRGVYAIVQPRLTALSNSTPFAWFDALVVVTIVATIAMWTVRIRKRQKGMGATIGGLAFDTAALAAVLYVWFLFAWGLNYQRQPLR